MHASVKPAIRSPDSGNGANEPGITNAIRNLTAQVIVVDEVGKKNEVDAVVQVTQQGMCIVGTAHFKSDGTDPLIKLMLDNEVSNGLIGGKAVTTLGDEAAKAAGVNKNKVGLKGPVPFKWCTATSTSFLGPFLAGPGFNAINALRDLLCTLYVIYCVLLYPYSSDAGRCLHSGGRSESGLQA